MIKHSKSSKIKMAYFAYKKSNIQSILQAFKNPSRFKKLAWQECNDICSEKNGYNLKIISYNTYHFTCGFLYDFKDDFGVVLDTFFVYITPSQIREISLNEQI